MSLALIFQLLIKFISAYLTSQKVVYHPSPQTHELPFFFKPLSSPHSLYEALKTAIKVYDVFCY